MPHFKSLLTQKVADSDPFVLLFDESLNKNQMKQMDYLSYKSMGS